MPQIVNIAIDQLFPHPDNPRKDLGDLTELADSIKASGVLQNLTVVPRLRDMTDDEYRTACAEYRANPTEEGQRIVNRHTVAEGYTIIIGHRRHAAALLAGLTELPCIVVEMDAREQLQTMLAENMQRSDLTVYEQAQGFQMMLDMGDSVSEIAEKSGFSQTTIRRRVKLLDLDQKKFQKAESRGATLSDYLELDKLESPDDKNKALDAIGTANFQSVLKGLISEQNVRKRIAEWTATAETFALPIEKSGEINGKKVDMIYFAGYNRWNLKKEMAVPEDAADTRYFFKTDSQGLTIYKERSQTQQPDPEDEAREERRRRDEQAQKEFEEVAETHFELRRDFVKGLPNSAFKRHMSEISLLCVATAEILDSGYCNSIDPEFCAYLLGMRISPEDEEEDFCDMGAIRSASEAQPEKLIFCACYSALDGGSESYYRRVWNAGHYEYEPCDNYNLNRVYEILEALGYELSDDEEAMADGSHRLFNEYGKQVEDDGDA